ncbi:hypothetical protein [Pseudovibrio sp. Ad37]|nr:hypothetical protein [Pseudovibrio sp. Ad37]KZL24272.1 putative transporter [Pseudovibrio sp. WM33]KZL28262.1 putative transporter [Pseudovibrio sp. Ad37]
MFIDAPLNTIKTCAIVTSIPLMFIISYMVYGFIKWMREDFALTSGEDILRQSREAAGAVPAE